MLYFYWLHAWHYTHLRPYLWIYLCIYSFLLFFFFNDSFLFLVCCFFFVYFCLTGCSGGPIRRKLCIMYSVGVCDFGRMVFSYSERGFILVSASCGGPKRKPFFVNSRSFVINFLKIICKYVLFLLLVVLFLSFPLYFLHVCFWSTTSNITIAH